MCRCFAAGFTGHNRCCLCLATAMAAHGASSLDNLPSDVADAIPVGSLAHRVCSCPAPSAARVAYAPEEVRRGPRRPKDVAAFMRALVPALDRDVPSPSPAATFTWVLCPPGGTVRARFFADGSRLDGPSSLLARNGWVFVAIDESGDVVAHARGVPPSWIVDIPGTEAWALLQAATVAEPGSEFRLDCKPCLDAIERGPSLARVFNVLFAAIDDTPVELFAWMPAHCGMDDVGRVRLSHGSRLTEFDRRANELADTSAKEAVKEHRVPVTVRKRVKATAQRVRELAMWLGRATHLANAQPGAQRRDSDASRRRTRSRRSDAAVAAPGRQHAARSASVPAARRALLPCLEPLRARIVARAVRRAQLADPAGGADAHSGGFLWLCQSLTCFFVWLCEPGACEGLSHAVGAHARRICVRVNLVHSVFTRTVG